LHGTGVFQKIGRDVQGAKSSTLGNRAREDAKAFVGHIDVDQGELLKDRIANQEVIDGHKM